MKRDLTLRILRRVLLCATLLALLPAGTTAQSPVFQNWELDLVTGKLSAANDDMWTAAPASNDPCEGWTNAVAVLSAHEILRQWYDSNGTVRDLSNELNDEQTLMDNNCGLAAVSVPNEVVGRGAGSVHMPPMMLAYLYLTKEQRVAFESHLSPKAKLQLRSWLDANSAISTKISAVISEEMQVKVVPDWRYDKPWNWKGSPPVLPPARIPGGPALPTR